VKIDKIFVKKSLVNLKKNRMNNSLVSKLIRKESFQLEINSRVPQFNEIEKLFSSLNIPYVTWKPDIKVKHVYLEMGFSSSCIFQDVYLLVFLLNDLGLEKIYPSREEKPVISIGTNLEGASHRGNWAIAEPIDISVFLNLDPLLSSMEIISKCFTNILEVDSEYLYEKSIIREDSSSEATLRDFHNYEKDTFYALTDGQYGDYDDWKQSGQDFDDLRDSLGD
jgi:hypothetical protein